MKKDTLGYYATFVFDTYISSDFKFILGKKVYKFVGLNHDITDDYTNTIVVALDVITRSYVCFNISDEKVSNKKIVVLN